MNLNNERKDNFIFNDVSDSRDVGIYNHGAGCVCE